MQKMKASKYPTKHNHPKHYSRPQDHALAQEAKQPVTKRHYTEKLFNADLMACVVLTAKVTKITDIDVSS